MDKFLQEIFERAKKESGEESLRKWAVHISDYLIEEQKFQLSAKTLERYYSGTTKPNKEKKDKLATYIGYASYKEFKEKHIEEKEHRTKPNAKKFGKNKILVALPLLVFVLLGAGYIGFSSAGEDCMIWDEDHFEATTCSGNSLEETWNEYRYENFKQIEVSPETKFFKADGSPRIWYDKHQKVMSYFTAPGINPETGKTVKEITRYMVKTHVLP